MSFLNELAAKRMQFLDGLDANEGDINLDIFEDFYPDKAHFVFELLQNAEDAGASQAVFILTRDGCCFEHDGKRQFIEDDVKGITGIHNSTKSGANDQIGKFGVGFKSVFVYCLTPRIYSTAFSFRIVRLVLPEPIDGNSQLGTRTRFEFPFNNPKKPAEEAYQEIREGLEQLAETTLLFLSHLESISWRIEGVEAGEVLRVQHSETHIEVLKQDGAKTTASWHFLRFSKPVEGLEKQNVSIAFALDCLPNVTSFDQRKPLAKQMRIVSAQPGRVAVFFPADKETSGLRFHLHAPFVPELSRASVKETVVNEPLFDQLAELAAESLHSIRDQKLLTADFLGVLPNPEDNLPQRYQGIRDAIVEEMNHEPLTPTHAKSFAPANSLLQARAALKDLLSKNDLDFLVILDGEAADWAIGASQKNSQVDRFLAGLAITDWDVEDFIEVLAERATERGAEPWYTKRPAPEFMEWLGDKSIDWHQQLYAVLRTALVASHNPQRLIARLREQKIVRISDGSYRVSKQSFFPNEDIEHDEVLPRVDMGVYSSGRSKRQQEDARKLLEEIGVREVGEFEQVESILKQRYTWDAAIPDVKTYRKDFKRFITLTEKDPTSTAMFSPYYVLNRVGDDWSKPSDVYLDMPYLDTGLNAYYEPLGEESPAMALSPMYSDIGVSVERVVRFAKAVGVQSELEVVRVSCEKNKCWSSMQDGSKRKSSNDAYRRQDDDFDIPEFGDLVEHQTEVSSQLIWRTMTTVVKPEHLSAKYCRNNVSDAHSAKSQLVHRLVDAAWVPQTNGRFVRPAEASRELLPKGFGFDKGYAWLAAIEFGDAEEKQSAEHRERSSTAEKLGFHDVESLERAQRFVELPQQEQERILAEAERRQSVELPDQEPRDPERRAGLVGLQAADAPERVTERRTRSVAVGREEVKLQASEYLRHQYTNPDGELICQICKSRMPFKLDDGSYYFEKVEFLPELRNRYYQNYLALCPNHGAMFQHTNGSKDDAKSMFVKILGNELKVVIAQGDASIYFTKVHIADLRKIIDVDEVGGGPSGGVVTI